MEVNTIQWPDRSLKKHVTESAWSSWDKLHSKNQPIEMEYKLGMGSSPATIKPTLARDIIHSNYDSQRNSSDIANVNRFFFYRIS